MAGKLKRITAADANTRKLLCKNGHVGLWVEERTGPGKESRRCNQCARDRARTAIYGITPKAFAQLKAANPVCGICGGNGEDHGRKILEIDHDHTTGEIRGMLCRRCNIFLGHYEHKKALILAIERYLKWHQS